MMETNSKVRATTIVAVRHKGRVAIGGDGQVTFGSTILKQKARKIRKLYQGKVLAGFSGATADAFTLFERFEGKLEQHHGNLLRAAVELAKDWRTDKTLRKLEALLIVINKDHSLIVSGTGDVVEPDDDIAAIGSGGSFALAAARALINHSDLDATAIVEQALTIASEICIYTNNNIVLEEL